jgi:phosphoglycerol transferase MdoB-like AlkP superfamily enzyme
MKISESTLRDYFRALFLCYIYILLLRVLELCWISRIHIVESLFRFELIGLLTDFFIVNALSAIILLFQILAGKSRRKPVNGVIITLIVLFGLFHILLLKYYVYILKPVDQFLFKYSFKELFFTISTSEVNFPAVIILIGVFIAIAFLVPKIFRHVRINTRKAVWFFPVILISVPLSFYSLRKNDRNDNDIRRNAIMNKSVFFYRKTISYLQHRHDDLALSHGQIQRFQSVFTGKEYSSVEYPLLHEQNVNDNIGSFFSPSDTLPNFVILIVEGLGQRFLDTFHGVHLMPYLDSLAGQSLYWDRFFTTGERSFAAVPSITGSLPYGQSGFTLLDPLPRHITMISLFKRYGYSTHFFDGQGAWFDQKDRFLRANDIDLIFDKSQFSSEYSKVMALKGKFFWGYQDHDLLQQSLVVLDTLPPGPRIDMYFTGSMHSPFPVDDPASYYERLENLTALSDVSGIDRKYLDKYRKYLITVLFFDRALEQFMEEYAKREDFDRTIFIITGDHPMTEIPIENSIRRYHVPLIIYSPLLKRSKRIHAAGSHLDVYPTILAFMRENYGLSIPGAGTCLGSILDTLQEYRSPSPLPFMDGNRAIIDYFEDGCYLTQGDRLFQADQDLNLNASVDPGRLKKMQENLDAYKRVNWYACVNDRLLPDSIYFHDLCFNQIQSVTKEIIDISGSTEYSEILPAITRPNQKELCLDLSYTLNFDPGCSLPTGVVQVNNLEDSTILWQPFSLIPSETNPGIHSVKLNVKTDTRKIQDSIIKIKVYLWNNNNCHVLLESLNAYLYQLSDCN